MGPHLEVARLRFKFEDFVAALLAACKLLLIRTISFPLCIDIEHDPMDDTFLGFKGFKCEVNQKA